MTQILHSASLRKRLTKILKQDCVELKNHGVQPYLKVVLVGEDPASIIYTQNKKKFCEKIGARCDIVSLPQNIDIQQFLKTIEDINSDTEIHGCIIQLPLPSHLKHLDMGRLISKEKDVDGFHPENLYALLKNTNDSKAFTSCTPKGILSLLQDFNIKISGSNIVIIGRSMIVGKPLALLLNNHDATVTIAHSKSLNLKSMTMNADIIISAVGKPKFIDASFLSSKKNQIIIDVGMNTLSNGALCGDVDYDNVFTNVSAITPVPGGVGPMTIVSLAQNLLQATKNRLSL